MPQEDHAAIERALDLQRDRVARYVCALRLFSATLWLGFAVALHHDAMAPISGYVMVALGIVLVERRSVWLVRRLGPSTTILDIAFLFAVRANAPTPGTDPIRMLLFTFAAFILLIFMNLFSLQRGVIALSALFAGVGESVALARAGYPQGIPGVV